MEYVSETSDVVVGDRVSRRASMASSRRASSWAGIESVEKSGSAYRRIVVAPAVDFSSLEEVLIVTAPRTSQWRRR